jgi:hypothetical protein
MGCKTFGVSQVLVGLHRVGVVGLRKAIQEVEGARIADREQILDILIESLRKENYLPDSQVVDFRTALWREVLRYRGEDFSEYFSQVEVTVRGEAGEDRDRFVDLLRSVFADFELRPVFIFAERADDGVHPLLAAGDQIIVRGLQTRANLKSAVRKSFSDW